MKTVPAKNLMCTIAANVNNPLLTDEQFREFVRNSAGIYQEVLEWREAMAQLGKDYSEHQLHPEVVPEKVQLSSAYGEFGTPLTPERKAELKGTVFEHCETEEEVTARHFDAMS